MITYEMIKDAEEQLIKNWGDAGLRVIEEAFKIIPFNNDSETFLTHCTACGGNWSGMLLTGIHKLYPAVWDAIPDNMGASPFSCICAVLILCGVDVTS